MAELVIRQAVESDRFAISQLILFETHVHRHLDWRAPIDWIGWSPFLVAVEGENIVAALACPMDLPGVAWIRLFTATDHVSYPYAWDQLWDQAQRLLSGSPGCSAAAIPLYPWFIDLLEHSHFSHTNDVIILRWESGMRMPDPQPGVFVRKMRADDLPAVYVVDSLAFPPLWQNSLDSLDIALTQAEVATVVEDASGIIGYQISTTSQMGGHIARLAVLPKKQGQNLGYALVYDVLRQFERRMIFRVTVNTQRDNLVSQSLYAKAGFKKTGESYLVFQKQV